MQNSSNNIAKEIQELQSDLARLQAAKNSLLAADFRTEFPKTSDLNKLAALAVKDVN